jgi:hypothetical protein
LYPQTPPPATTLSNNAGVTEKGLQKQRREERMHKQDVPRPHEDEDQQMAILQESLKKSKNLRTDREVSSSRERTRSKTRAALP